MRGPAEWLLASQGLCCIELVHIYLFAIHSLASINMLSQILLEKFSMVHLSAASQDVTLQFTSVNAILS
jgi:hypothetical protein